jgi:uncharacterized protein (TIGR02246 family)
MRNGLFIAMVLCGVGCRPTLGRAGDPITDADDAAVVRHLEEDVAAATERNDADALAPYLAPDFSFVNPAGLLLTKERFLSNLRSGRLRNTSYKVDDMQVRVYGAAAVVIYRSTVAGTAGMQSVAPQRWRTTTLIKRDGRWLLVAQQSTPILTAPPRPPGE